MIKNEKLNFSEKEEKSVNSIEEEDGFIKSNEYKEGDIENIPKRYSPNSMKKITHTNNLNNLILSCVKNDEYCYTLLDYMKKMFHFSQIDYYSAYTQLIYCFRPKEM